MSGRKNNLLKFKVIDAVSMGASITSAVTNINFLDNIAYQLVFTGTPTGTFSVEVSVDHAQDSLGNVTVAGTWTALTLSPTPAATGAAGDVYIDLNQLSAPWVRVKYTRASSTGTLTAYISAKQL